MYNHYGSTSISLTNYLMITLLTVGISGCSVFHAPPTQPIAQPAATLVNEIKAEQLSTETQIISMFSTQGTNDTLPTSTQKALKTYPVLAANLLITMSKSENIQQSIINFIEKHIENQSEYIYVALTLYPIDGYRLAEKLALRDDVDNEIITTASLRAGFDPALIFPATSSSDLDYRIVPLIESASITLYNKNEDSSAAIWFKAQNDAQWQEGLALQWEPIQGALSGSMVYLESDTQYTVKVSLSENNEVVSEDEYTFTTRAESPPIDPEKIYYLSDIYQGGQFDLEALGIEGSESGWAKIVGDGVTVEANDGDLSAVYLGSQNYVMLENVTTIGGERYGIHGYKGHHTWIKGCDISNYGRVPDDIRDGKAYSSTESTSPINYDSGIYLERSGVVVIEDCEVHSPNGKANSWEYGHPNGPNALQVWGKHDNLAYRGQYIVRNNRFYGTPKHRFNDVIEGRGNRSREGGFVRDSAIYNNYIAYSNDDLIELDGGQANVLFYNNELTQGYCGISTAPNMIGPSYVFHNYIHDLGDERGKEWTAIKMGGLMSSPSGITNVFENLIITDRNGISASRVDGDYTFWVNAVNNIIINRRTNNLVGYGIFDRELYAQSEFVNNLIHNTSLDTPKIQAIESKDFYHPSSFEPAFVSDIIQSPFPTLLEIDSSFILANFSRLARERASSSEQLGTVTPLIFNASELTSFANQNKDNLFQIDPNGLGLTLIGNTWKALNYTYTLTDSTIIEFDLTHNGLGEIIGLAVETDNQLSHDRLFKFYGSQSWELDDLVAESIDDVATIRLNVGQYVTGEITKIVFVSDYDQTQGSIKPSTTFENIRIYEGVAVTSDSVETNTTSLIPIGSSAF